MTGGDVAVDDGAKVTTTISTALSGVSVVGKGVVFGAFWVSIVLPFSTTLAVNVGRGVDVETTVDVRRSVTVARGVSVATGNDVAVGTIGSGVGVAVTVVVGEGPDVGKT